MDRFKITLRVSGDDLVPERITSLLQCQPTNSETKDVPTERGRVPRTGRWAFTVEDYEDKDLQDVLEILLRQLPSDAILWENLTTKYKVDIFCGLFLATHNRGFSLSAELSKMLSDRHLAIGFDVYFDLR